VPKKKSNNVIKNENIIQIDDCIIKLKKINAFKDKKNYEIKAIIAFIYNIISGNKSPLYPNMLNIIMPSIKGVFTDMPI